MAKMNLFDDGCRAAAQRARSTAPLRWLPLLGANALLLLCACACAARTVGDPHAPQTLAADLAAAYAAGDRDLTIAPGTYTLPATKHDSILLDHWRDAAVHAPGVTLIFEDLSHRPVHFRHCENVTFDSATLRLSIGAATQGKITAIGSDARGHFFDWQIDAGYTAKFNPLKSMLDVIDAKTRVLKVGTGDNTPSAIEVLGPGCWRLRFNGASSDLAVGDWLITRAGDGSVICHVDDCQNVTLRGLTMQNGGFGTFFETGGVGGNHYLHCRIECGPRPDGATEDPIVSCGADGFHSTQTQHGPDIEDCDFTGVFHDDCIAIHGSFQNVISGTDKTLILASGADQYAVGDPVRISDEHGLFVQVHCVGVKHLDGGKIELRTDTQLELPAGAKANNPNRCGSGYRILRCRLGNTRSRGILVKADDGLIDSCTIEGCGMSAISVGPEYYWGEANYCWSVTLSHNIIRQCVKNFGDEGAILVHGDGALGNRGIIIRDNTFDSNYGLYQMNLQYTDGLIVEKNVFGHCFDRSIPKAQYALYIAHDRNVKLADNLIVNPGPFLRGPIHHGGGIFGTIPHRGVDIVHTPVK